MIGEALKELGRESDTLKRGDIIECHQEEYYEIKDISSTGKTVYVVGNYAVNKRIRTSECTLICPREWRVN